MKDSQIYERYEKWEDFNNGMFTLSDVIDKDIKVFKSIELLKNDIIFYNTMKLMLEAWPISKSVNLSNKNQNRRAWLGAAACMFSHNSPEYLTRIAWNLLNKEVQNKANLVAEKIIKEYERENSKLHRDLGETMLF